MDAIEIITLIGVVIAACGVVVTGIFSYFVWKATQETAKATQESAKAAQESANVAKASYILIEQIELRNTQTNESKKAMHARLIYISLCKVARFLFGVSTTTLAINELHNILHEATTPNESVLDIFDKEDRDSIIEAWEVFHKYINDFWRGNGELGILAEGRGNKDSMEAAGIIANKLIKISTNMQQKHGISPYEFR